MEIRKEIERLQVEKQVEKETLEQERLRVVGRINERVDSLNEQARALIRPHLQILQQSGAIEVLRELKEEVGGEMDDVHIQAGVAYSGKIPRQRSQDGELVFIGEDLRGVTEQNLIYEYFSYYPDTYKPSSYNSMEEEEKNSGRYPGAQFSFSLDDLKKREKSLCLLNSKRFKVEYCRVSLLLAYDYHSASHDGSAYTEEKVIWFDSFLRPHRRVELRGDNSFKGEAKELSPLSIPENQWGNRELLEKIVARAYFDLERKVFE